MSGEWICVSGVEVITIFYTSCTSVVPLLAVVPVSLVSESPDDREWQILAMGSVLHEQRTTLPHVNLSINLQL